MEKRWRNPVSFAVAAAIPLLFFVVLPPLSKSGLWDPYELNVAELSRRIALNLFGAPQLSLAGADNSIPHLNDLGRPQLAFSSVALGFKLFGLHEWAGRLPLAIWGWLGVLSIYGFVARFFDRRAGIYAALALTTMPLYFVQARSIIGDIVAMSALAMAFSGLIVATLDAQPIFTRAGRARLAWLVVGIVGLVAGFGSRGGLIGVAVPLLSVGLAWGVIRLSGRRPSDPLGDTVACVSLIVAAFIVVYAQRAIAVVHSPNLDLWVGGMIKTSPKVLTFDFGLDQMGHALAPWSAFIPFALGRLFIPPVRRSGDAYDRESFARAAILVGAGTMFAVHGLLAAWVEPAVFTGAALFAAACAVALRDLEKGAPASVAVGVGVVVLLGLFHHDFHEFPDKAYQAFGVVGAVFPDSFKNTALVLWTVVLVGFAGMALLTWIERGGRRRPFNREAYAAVVKSLREAWNGLLMLGFFAVVAGAVIAALIIFIGVRSQAPWVSTVSAPIRNAVLNAWWVIGILPLAAIFGTMVAADTWQWAFSRTHRIGRTAFFATTAGVIGFVLCFFYYPALADQLSPKGIFERYEHIRKSDEPLALLGVGGRTSAYYAGGQPVLLSDATSAFTWLGAGQGQRRFLAVKADELPRLNKMFREQSTPRMNLPVVDAHSSQIVLVSSALGGDANQNPFDGVVVEGVVHPQRVLDVNLDDKLRVLGLDIEDADGHRVEVVTPGTKYHIKTYFKVLQNLTSEWDMFIHIDGYRRRHNGDHKPLKGKYPLTLWLSDDTVVDDYEFSLEPNFSSGTYTIFFGLYAGDTRLKVKSGANDGDNRVDGGQLRVQ